MTMTLSSTLTDTELLTPEAFLKKLSEDKHLIKQSRFIAPRLGQPGFGQFEVQYKHPIFRPVFDCDP